MGEHFIKSGEWNVHQGPAVIRTDLGSCVALCLWDFTARLGGMNHYLLPGSPEELNMDARRGYVANRQLLDAMLRRGAQREHLRAALIGGGSRLENDDVFGIGDSNVRVGLELLSQYNIPVCYRRTGGAVGRHVCMDIDSRELRIREITMGTSVVKELVGTLLG